MFDIIIIGAGVIGLSIARAIGERTNLSVLIIDKEDDFGRGISSRNSEVIHSGLYYEPNSLKAKVCVDGAKRLKEWIFNKKIPIDIEKVDVTPTFIFIQNEKEKGRIFGYSNPEMFWWRVDEILEIN